ncbi:MAG: AmmeMemoRadiSam system protein B [Thermoprotei archaeon]
MLRDYTRYPAVAGYFYPDNPKELKDLISQLFIHSLGPGRQPTVSPTRRIETIGYVAPHAGYIYSGPVAAHVYYSLALDGKPDTIIIIGTNHTGMGSLISVYPSGKWITPLGSLVVDKELATKIAEYSELADLDTEAHVEEHSVEVQLPFVQYIFGDSVLIVPIVIGLHTPEAAKDLASSIHKAVSELKRDIVIIASSDFNHYEPYEVTKKKDMEAIEKILQLDTTGFYEVIRDRHISVCGPGGIMTLIEYTKIRSTEKCCAELLKYANSGDVSGDKSAVVGYAAIRFYQSIK